MFPSGSRPSKACHNCRRKRWKCDRSLPSCMKCLAAGVECLGYGKLFIWNRGVASRGKMMGKTFENWNIAAEASNTSDNEPQATRISTSSTPDSGAYSDGSLMAVSDQRALPNATIHWPLVDPVIRGLNSSSRSYLHHFATKLCAHIVAFDGPNNPMRGLVSLSTSFPSLLQIMIANSALHVFNLSRNPTRPFLIHNRDGANQLEGLKNHDVPSQLFYQDALAAKQEALQLLAQSITVVNEANFDLVLGAILLFINMDLIESGLDKWSFHLEGARDVIALLGNPSYQLRPMSSIRTFLLSDFLIFFVLASTLPFSSVTQLFPEGVDVTPILLYAETNNYLSCPAPLLSIMLESFSLSGARVISEDSEVEQQEKLRILMEHALAFDPVEWLSHFKPVSHLDDLDKRLHMAWAHRAAVCIYLARFIPYSHPFLDPSSGVAVLSLTGLATEIVHHISHITPADVLFKSINWPLFLAGAESDDPAERAWIMDTLDCLYDALRWGYILTNKKMLESIWSFKAQGAACWVTEVMKMDTQMLIA